MNPRSSLRLVWLGAFTSFWRMWTLGWLMVGKFFLAAVIIWFGYVLIGFFSQFERLLPPDSPWPSAVWIIAMVLVLGVYLPLTFYVAASWVGFCPRVDQDDLPA